MAHAAAAKEAEVKTADKQTKCKKFAVRFVTSVVMFFILVSVLWMGHVAVCTTLVILQARVFFEMVNLRYVEAKENDMPLFRTLQWAWFVVAAIYAHGSSWLKAPMGVDQAVLHTFLLKYLPESVVSEHAMFDFFAFALFSGVFVISVLSLKPGMYDYQITQLTWTFMVILVVVVQMKTVVHNVYNGMFWFIFPFSSVVVNDTMAYIFGFLLGKKICGCKFLSLSPNKTWEGFIGGLLSTCCWGLWFAPWLMSFRSMRCTYNELQNALPGLPETCHSDHLLEGTAFWGMFPPISAHSLTVALFVSLVAPFGGFWASAIKRATGIEDFASVFPGHGGFTDRFDCHFVVFMFVHVYFSTFVGVPSVQLSFAETLSAAMHLPSDQQLKLIAKLQEGQFP